MQGGGHLFVGVLRKSGPQRLHFGRLMAHIHVVFRGDLEGWWGMTR